VDLVIVLRFKDFGEEKWVIGDALSDSADGVEGCGQGAGQRVCWSLVRSLIRGWVAGKVRDNLVLR
jgi:hypothetical protein